MIKGPPPKFHGTRDNLSESPALYGVISDQTTLSITGDQRAHARLRCNWVFIIV